MAQQNQLAKPVFPELSPQHQQFLSQLVDTVNSLSGYNGVIKLNNHIDLGGAQIKNLGAPTAPTDALAHGIAEASYSAPALAPKLQANGSSPMSSYRILNSSTQREQSSSYLNDVMSIVPSANGIYPTLTNVGGGVQCSIPSALFTFADGSSVMLNGRTDLLPSPAQFAISSISCAGNVVTVDAAATGLVAGEVGTIAGVTPSQFNGTYTFTSSSGGGTTLEYQADLGTLAGTGGYVQVAGVYYFSVKKRSQNITLNGPFSGDTLDNRLQVNKDGSQIVAVVVVTNSGGQVEQSGGGGSAIVGSPTAGSFF